MKNSNTVQEIGTQISAKIDCGTGFFLMVFPLGDDPDCDYVSNCKHEDVIIMMKEFLIRNGEEADWIKNLVASEKVPTKKYTREDAKDESVWLVTSYHNKKPHLIQVWEDHYRLFGTSMWCKLDYIIEWVREIQY